MKLIRNPETKGILFILLIALVLATVLAGASGKLEQWGLPWFTGAKVTDKIVFVSDRSGTREVYIMDLNGSGQKQLTRDARVLSAPVMSPKGNKIAFVGMIGSTSQVLAVGVNGGTPYSLTSSTGSKRQPGYSPDGQKLSYIERGRVFVAELNGSNNEPLLPTSEEMVMARSNPDGGGIPLYSAYAWAPDSESMAGVSSTDRISDALVYLPKPPAEELRRLTPPKAMVKVTGLAFAARKPIMAASLDFNNQGILVLFDAETNEPKQLLALPKMRFGKPAVSPDGDVILLPVESRMGKTAVLIKVDLLSGKAGTLCKGRFENPVYSPKGDAVLAARFDAKTGRRSIVTIDPTSGEVRGLATKGDCFDATFSPMTRN